MNILKEFGPSIAFLAKFIILYLVLNLLYGFYINSYDPYPDPVTTIVAEQTSAVLALFGEENQTYAQNSKTGVWISSPERSVLSVYEGCNGLNVFIIFFSFLLAYGKPRKALIWFIPLGAVVIHVFNLARIGLLYHVTLYYPDLTYFTHKYLFTAIIYGVIFLLWLLWVLKIYPAKK
jgi:exosortase family protein XrtF